MTRHTPAHVTLKLRRSRADLRSRSIYPHVERALTASSERESFRLIHFSVQHDHVHLICEADDNDALSSGIRALTIRIARRVNKVLGGRGRLFKDRYHLRLLRTPPDARAAVAYVLGNGRKHLLQIGCEVSEAWVDPCCSSASLGGGERAVALPAAQSWLLSEASQIIAQSSSTRASTRSSELT